MARSQILALVLLVACLVATVAFDTNDVHVAGASVSDITGPVALVLIVYLLVDLRRSRRARRAAA